MRHLPSGSVLGAGPQVACAGGNHSDPGSCATFRVVPFWARGPRWHAREGTTRILVHAPPSEWFRSGRGAPGGMRGREPLGSWFMRHLPSGSVLGAGPQVACAGGNHSDPGSCATFRVVPFWARGPRWHAREGTTRILVHAPPSEWFRSGRGAPGGMRGREPLGSWFMRHLPSGSVLGAGPQVACAGGNHSDPGSCATFRVVPFWARGPRWHAREGTTRILVHAPPSEWFRSGRGAPGGMRGREPLGSWFMRHLPSGSVLGAGPQVACAGGNHSDPGSCATFRVVPFWARGPRWHAREGTTRILVHAPPSERFRSGRGAPGG